ncbi:MAG: YecA family protein [Solirubrobacteraceae bacterium]
MELALKMDADAPEKFRRLVIDLRDAMAGPDGIQPGGLCVVASSLLAARLARDGHPARVVLAQYAPLPDDDGDVAHAYARCGSWALDATREQFAHLENCGEPDDHALLVFRAGTADDHYRPWRGNEYQPQPTWDLDMVRKLRDEQRPLAEIAAWLTAVGLEDPLTSATRSGPLPARRCECCLAPSTRRIVFARGDERQEVPVCDRHARQAARLQRVTAPIGRNDPCSCGSGRKHKRCCGA